MTTNRPTGAIARIIHPEHLLNLGRAAYVAAYPDANPNDLTNAYEPHMLIAVDRGTGAIVNHEGVGSTFTEHDTVKVTFALGYGAIALHLAVDDVAMILTDETIDLADGIRTFGSRLDANHAAWFARYDHTYRAHLAN